MKVALVHDAAFPVLHYGGTERVIWWLAKGLSERGIEVILACRPGSKCPFAKTVPVDFSRPVERQVPADVELLHYFYTPGEPDRGRPYLATIGGNGKLGERFVRNTVFVSRNHARRHNAECYVYNGLDPDDYEYSDSKDRYLLFLAKASWSVKNVRGAIRFALRTGRPLRIVGGKRRGLIRKYWSWRGIQWEGMLGGEKKARIVSRATGLLFPVLWNEPFGIAVAEAMVSGTPVLATPHGSMPELVGPGTGKLCVSEEEFLRAIPELGSFKPSVCREWAMEKFHYRRMTESYLGLYEKVLRGEALNPVEPTAQEPPGTIFPIPHRIS